MRLDYCLSSSLNDCEKVSLGKGWRKNSVAHAGRWLFARSCEVERKRGNIQLAPQDEVLVRSMAEAHGGCACCHFFTNIWWEPHALALLGIPKNKIS